MKNRAAPQRASTAVRANPADLAAIVGGEADKLAARLASAEGSVRARTQDYLDWAEAALRELEGLVAQAGGEDGEAARRLDQAYDILHNLKGSGVLFGYELVSAVADSGCTLIRGRGAIDAIRRDVLRRHVEGMRLVIAQRISGSGGEPGSRLLRRLADLSQTCG